MRILAATVAFAIILVVALLAIHYLDVALTQIDKATALLETEEPVASISKEVSEKDVVYLTFKQTFGPNDAIAPHLYDWYFDGENDYIEVADSDVFNMSNYAVELLFKPLSFINPSTGNKAHWVYKKQYIAIITTAEGKVNVRTLDSSNAIVSHYSTVAIELEKYHLITYNVYETGKIELFINSEYDSSKDFTGPPTANTDNIYIGRADVEGYEGKGYVAFVRIYNRTLSEKEIREHYYYVKNMISKPRFPIFYKYRRTKFVPALA